MIRKEKCFDHMQRNHLSILQSMIQISSAMIVGSVLRKDRMNHVNRKAFLPLNYIKIANPDAKKPKKKNVFLT